METIKQSEMNIGTLGHIDHGKTSLVKSLTNIWTDRHSESIKRNMTIKLGYADAIIRKCDSCKGAEAYTIGERCERCGSEAKPVLRFSILDAPGHETLMATAISGANIINGILFIIAANEPCPMQQTREHLMIINLLGLKNAIIVQTKVDLVGRDKAIEHYKQIKAFIKGSVIENAPIIPAVPNKNVNINVILETISKLERPKFDKEADPLMYIARSFDVNKPGSDISKLKGGVVGGTIIRGVLKKGDTISILPGANLQKKGKHESYSEVVTTISGISSGTEELDEAHPGGLIGISTEVDPALTKADAFVGMVLGYKGKLPLVVTEIDALYTSLARTDLPTIGFGKDEPIALSVGTATVLSYVTGSKRNRLKIRLSHPTPIERGLKMAVMRRINHRLRLTGFAVMV